MYIRRYLGKSDKVSHIDTTELMKSPVNPFLTSEMSDMKTYRGFLVNCSPALQTISNPHSPEISHCLHSRLMTLPLPSRRSSQSPLEPMSSALLTLSTCLHPHTSNAGLLPGPLTQLALCTTCCRQLGLCRAVSFTLSKVPLTHPEDVAQRPQQS